jgi:hypothetical protein
MMPPSAESAVLPGMLGVWPTGLLLLAAFTLIASLGGLLWQILAWEQQLEQARPILLHRFRHASEELRTLRQQTESMYAAFEASPLTLSPVKTGKLILFLLKTLKITGPFRLFTLLR